MAQGRSSDRRKISSECSIPGWESHSCSECFCLRRRSLHLSGIKRPWHRRLQRSEACEGISIAVPSPCRSRGATLFRWWILFAETGVLCSGQHSERYVQLDLDRKRQSTEKSRPIEEDSNWSGYRWKFVRTSVFDLWASILHSPPLGNFINVIEMVRWRERRRPRSRPKIEGLSLSWTQMMKVIWLSVNRSDSDICDNAFVVKARRASIKPVIIVFRYVQIDLSAGEIDVTYDI